MSRTPRRRRGSRAPGEHAGARGRGARLPSRGPVVTTAPAFQPADRPARGTRPRLPRLRAVLREQVRATGFALRGPALIGAALVALLTLAVALQGVSMGAVINLYEWPTHAARAHGRAAAHRGVGAGRALRAGLPLDAPRGPPPARLDEGARRVGVADGWRRALRALAARAQPRSGGRVLPPETLPVFGPQIPVARPIDSTALRATAGHPALGSGPSRSPRRP